MATNPREAIKADILSWILSEEIFIRRRSIGPLLHDQTATLEPNFSAFSVKDLRKIISEHIKSSENDIEESTTSRVVAIAILTVVIAHLVHDSEGQFRVEAEEKKSEMSEKTSESAEDETVERSR